MKKWQIIICVIFLLLCHAPCSHAASYSYSLGQYPTNYGMVSYSVSDIDLLGFNKTQGFTQKILGTTSTSYVSGNGGRQSLTLNYTVPDDGSTWQIVGTVQVLQFYSDYEGGFAGSSICALVNVDQTVTTSGTYTGVSIGQAVNAANAASSAAGQALTAANIANTAAASASTAANNAVTVATQARDAANSASVNAGAASTNALSAYNEAVAINSKLDALSGHVSTLDTSEIIVAVKDPKGTVIDVSRASHDAVEDSSGNTITAVRDTDGTVLDASRAAGTNSLNAYNEAVTVNSKIDNLQTTVNNYMTMDTTPPVVNLSTVSGARATSGNFIQAVLNISDNVSTSFQYSLDDTDFVPVPTDKLITLPVAHPGSNVISVWVKDEVGNVGTSSITIRRL
jgi:hypothetical protein